MRRLALAIARAGRPEQCWRGICSERCFQIWKKRIRMTMNERYDFNRGNHFRIRRV